LRVAVAYTAEDTVFPTPLKKALFDYHYRAVTLPRAERLECALAEQVGRVESVLDVGCGDGAIARAVAGRVGATRVAGVDVVQRPSPRIPVQIYDGLEIPHADEAFDAVTLVDVLHHCSEPGAVLKEALRVARLRVVIKDHFGFGPISRGILYLMDLPNYRDSVAVPGTYFDPHQWVRMINEAGGTIEHLIWPMKINDLPFRLIARSEFQFMMRVAKVERS
jgi:SAM-dependent methyltransferase